MQKAKHHEIGTVSTTDERYTSVRDACLAQYLRAKAETKESMQQTKLRKGVGLLSNDFSAALEMMQTLESNPQAVRYADECTKKQGWERL